MCKNTSNFDEHLFEGLKETLDTLDSCVTPSGENTSLIQCLSGWPVRWSGGLVQARRANVQARRADKGDSVKIAPGASCKNPGASLGFKRCSTLQFDPKVAVLVLGRHGIRLSVLKLKISPSTLFFYINSKQVLTVLNFGK